MKARQLWATIETPDGVVIPGPHGTSGASEIYPGISSAVFFIVSGNEALITDPGFRTDPSYPPGVVQKVCEIIDGRDLDLKYLVQTHWHFDHTGNTEFIKDRYDPEVVCHPDEQEILEDPLIATRPDYIESFGGDVDEIAADFNLDDASSVTMPEEAIREHWYFPVEVDSTVEDGDVLTVGDLEIEVLHTPGHTPGHLSLWNPSTSSLYLVDVMYWPTPLHPHPIGKIEDQLDSIDKCLSLEADYLFPGHELPRCGTYDVEDYLKDLKLKHLQLEDRVLTVLSRHGAQSIPDLYTECFVIKDRYDYSHDGWYTYSLNCLQAHMRHLLDAGLVERVEASDGTVRWEVTSEGERPDPELAVEGSYERVVQTLDDVEGPAGENERVAQTVADGGETEG